MSELACHCLNVRILYETNDFEKVKVDSLQLPDDMLVDPFFRQEMRWVRLVTSVTSHIPWLVGTRHIGPYSIHHCYNCDVQTHATHREHDNTDVITSANLLDSAAILAAKNDRQYSSSYNIKINTDIRNLPNAFINMLPEEKVIVNNLMQKANEYINREMAAVEDRIRQYSEQQHAIFEKYKDSVMLEHEALYRKVLENKRRASKENSLSTKNLSTGPVNVRGSPRSTVPENIVNSPRRTSLNDRAKSNQVSSPRPIAVNRGRVSVSNQASSFDCEGFFPLDDMDDDPSFDTLSDDSDTEPSSNYGRDITSEQQNARRTSMHMARSLPVSIPPNTCPFMAYNNHVNEENDDRMPEESMDIAASIKALAKSIQGDTIFGDLPARPRFSSQI